MLLASTEVGALAATGVPHQAITVDLDLTFLVQTVLFVGFMLILKPVLFDPMLKLFEERERRIDGAKAEARKVDEKSAHALEQYEAAMARARTAANAERDKIRSEGLAREQEILGRVRELTNRAVDEGKRAAHLEANRVRGQLKADAAQLARDLATRVLGREVQP